VNQRRWGLPLGGIKSSLEIACNTSMPVIPTGTYTHMPILSQQWLTRCSCPMCYRYASLLALGA